MMMPNAIIPHQFHVCCVALGTRGDVQPVACIASHLQRTYDHVSVSFITHAAHESWLDSGTYTILKGRVAYIASHPAGGCWAPPAAPPPTPGLHSYSGPSVAAKSPYITGQGDSTGQGQEHGDTSITQPDPRVIEAICNRISAVMDDVSEPSAPSPPLPQSPPLLLEPPLCPPPPALCTTLGQRVRMLRRRLLSQPAHEGALHLHDGVKKPRSRGSQAPVPRHQAGTEEPKEEEHGGEVEEEEQQQQQPKEQRHVILFNLFALEAYHAAEALGLPCAVAAPYMIPYRCPAGFIGMFRQELPDLYDALSWSEKLQQLQQQQQQELPADAGPGCGAVAVTVIDTEMAVRAELAPKPREASKQWLRHPRITFSEVTHWMWPLFTERWGEWRRTVLGLPALPLHRRRVKTHGSEHNWPGGTGGAGVAKGKPEQDNDNDDDGEPENVDSDDGEEALPLECLPPAPPLLYGFSELLVPRPAYWPRSVTVCGFWQPSLEWFAGQQLPTELAEVLGAAAPAATTATATAPIIRSPALPSPPSPPSSTDSRWCLVDFGSCGRMGFIPAPLETLTLLDAVLRLLDMKALLLTGGWQPFHRAAAELHESSSRASQTLCRQPQKHGQEEQGEQGEQGKELPQQQPAPPEQRVQPQLVGRGKRRRELEMEPDVDAGVEAAAEQLGAGSTSVAAVRLVQNTAIDAAAAAVEGCSKEAAAKPSQLPLEPQPPRIHLYGGDVAHQLVLPYCRVVLHHGGSGTTAAALQCGIPQVTCPVHFDQHFWAERVAHLGVASAPLDRRVLFGPMATAAKDCRHSTTTTTSDASSSARVESPAGHDEVLSSNDPRVVSLTAAFRDALEPSKLTAARMMAQDLAAEGGGLETAARVLLRIAAGHQK
ncbi:hypothetical protein Vretimale_14938 [Volvox reticuliferus]|nr:hypothetical protein Vretimale_14938 [Volvox reticuliferus]